MRERGGTKRDVRGGAIAREALKKSRYQGEVTKASMINRLTGHHEILQQGMGLLLFY